MSAFAIKPAVRRSIPLFLGISGPSGGGKTFSALRVGSGILRVTGGKMFMIDTENRRALHYADRFNFMHLDFGEPFSPERYLEAVEECVRQGARVIVIDSMSHEHEGPGGVLDLHDAEVRRLAGDDPAKAMRVTFQAWAKPKAMRRRFLMRIVQLGVNVITCYRAKEKLRPVKGKEPEEQGWMPISGDEYVYEMTANVLLLPAANGCPTWRSEFPGERQMMKLPLQFRDILRDGVQLSEDIGEAMARWAAGGVQVDPLVERFRACADADGLAALKEEIRAAWAGMSSTNRVAIQAATPEVEARVRGAEQAREADADAARRQALPRSHPDAIPPDEEVAL